MINKNEWLIVGLITSCHGINGQLKVKSLSDFDLDWESLKSLKNHLGDAHQIIEKVVNDHHG